MKTSSSRRHFLTAGMTVAGFSLTGSPRAAAADDDDNEKRDADSKKKADDKDTGKKDEGGQEEEEDVSPAEDLMREHGVLKRILLVYEDAISRLDGGRDLSPDPVLSAAKLVRHFVEDYHEKLEEDFLFPRFRKARVEVELVDVLAAQHEAGRRLTDMAIRLANLKSLREKDTKAEFRQALAAFVRMYAPHEAREDTVLFPALRKIVSRHEYDSLGEDFEKKEHQLFGADGFEKMVSEVAGIEKALGIYDLAQFTPR
jgi:hemerythrin-like domain-containing protein